MKRVVVEQQPDDDGICDGPYADEYYDCAGNCLSDVDGDLVCDENEIVGCQDTTACNYDETATDEGSCTYAEDNFDCDGCIVDVDCNGVCGGDRQMLVIIVMDQDVVMKMELLLHMVKFH